MIGEQGSVVANGRTPEHFLLMFGFLFCFCFNFSFAGTFPSLLLSPLRSFYCASQLCLSAVGGVLVHSKRAECIIGRAGALYVCALVGISRLVG